MTEHLTPPVSDDHVCNLIATSLNALPELGKRYLSDKYKEEIIVVLF